MKRIVTFFMALLAVMLAMADSVTPERALSMAQAFMSGGKAKFCASADVSLKLAYQAHSFESKPDYYVFNRGNGGGYIVVTGDDRTIPVWGYSTSGTFDYESLPENAKWWLSEYQRQLQYLRDHPEAKARKISALSTSVEPLLSTKWDQCAPYNDRCPVTPDCENASYNNRAPTGCTATAMAQIMKKHEWPKVGTGHNTYTCKVEWSDNYGSSHSYTANLSSDFSRSNYQWGQMLDNYPNDFSSYSNEQRESVAKLMSDIGIAVNTDYGDVEISGSSAGSEDVKLAFKNYFKYDAELYNRSDYDDDVWDANLRSELDKGFPIWYRGSRKVNLLKYSGHAFVFDGYDNEGRFHVNWGWGGSADNYYLSSLLQPSEGRNYEYDQACVVAKPLKDDKELIALVKGNSGWDVVRVNSHASASISVIGQNLDQDVNISLVGNDASMFSTVGSISASEANAQGGKTVKLVYAPTVVGTHTTQIVVSAGEDVDPITLTVTGTAKLYCDADGDEQMNIDDLTFAIDQLLAGGELNHTGTYASIDDITSIIDALLGISSSIDVDDGLVAYYPFNGNANDESGNGNHGQVTNLALTQGVNGDSYGAYQFGGYYNQGHILVPNSESLKFTDGFTFACYVKPTEWNGMDGWANYSTSGVHCIFAKSTDRNGPHMSFNGDNSNMNVGVGTMHSGSQWTSISSNGQFQGNHKDEWVHVTVTYSKTLARLYINGNLVKQSNISADFNTLNANDLYFGAFPLPGSWADWWYPMNGVMDEVRIYNRALNPAEVNELAMDNEFSHPFRLSKREVTLFVGETVTVNMFNGSGCYSVGSNVGIVDFSLDGDSFTLTGTGVGTTNVTVIDVATQTTILLPVTVIQPDNKKLLLSEEVNGVRYRLFKEVLDQNDTHVNADGWTFFRSRLSLDVIRNNVARTYVLDENLYLDSADNDAQTATMLFDLRTSEMKVFINSKTSGSNYSMDGFCYTSSMNSIAYSKETVFSSKNWGWWPFWVYSNGSISLSHFSYGGYYYMTSSRNESGTWSNTTGRKIYPNDFRSIWEQTDLTLVIQ